MRFCICAIQSYLLYSMRLCLLPYSGLSLKSCLVPYKKFHCCIWRKIFFNKLQCCSVTVSKFCIIAPLCIWVWYHSCKRLEILSCDEWFWSPPAVVALSAIVCFFQHSDCWWMSIHAPSTNMCISNMCRIIKPSYLHWFSVVLVLRGPKPISCVLHCPLM